MKSHHILIAIVLVIVGYKAYLAYMGIPFFSTDFSMASTSS
jgi:hypothetical protein